MWATSVFVCIRAHSRSPLLYFKSTPMAIQMPQYINRSLNIDQNVKKIQHKINRIKAAPQKKRPERMNKANVHNASTWMRFVLIVCACSFDVFSLFCFFYCYEHLHRFRVRKQQNVRIVKILQKIFGRFFCIWFGKLNFFITILISKLFTPDFICAWKFMDEKLQPSFYLSIAGILTNSCELNKLEWSYFVFLCFVCASESCTKLEPINLLP